MKILEQTHDQFADAFYRRYGKGTHYSSPVYKQVMKTGKADFTRSDLFKRIPQLAEALGADLVLPAGRRMETMTSGDVVKFITTLEDGQRIESVSIPMYERTTLCVSSQVGCRMGCLFCRTGKMGLIRNLSAEEIVGQLFTARHHLGFKIRNVVFMGMGEPLDNLDNVVRAIRVMEDQRGLDIARRYITVSTVGLAQGIDRLARIDGSAVNLAVSLNAPTDEIRSFLMPVNRRVSLAVLKEALERYPLSKKSSLFFEYVLIQDVNDRPEHARALGQFLSPLKAKVNLIPYNPAPGSSWVQPTARNFERFRKTLINNGIFVRCRTEKGGCIMAACGQLGGK